MNIAAFGASRTTPPPLDIYDEKGGAAAGGLTLLPQGAVPFPADYAFWSDVLGAGHGWDTNTLYGVRVRSSPEVFGHGARTNLIDFRLGSNWSTNNVQAAIYGRRRFTFECAVSCPAGGDGEIGLRTSANSLDVGNTILGYSLRGVAGSWAGFRRLVTGNPESGFGLLQSFSVTPLRLLRIEFTEGPAPRLQFFLDNVLTLDASGQAAMPELQAANVTYCPAVASRGARIITARARLRMEYV